MNINTLIPTTSGLIPLKYINKNDLIFNQKGKQIEVSKIEFTFDNSYNSYKIFLSDQEELILSEKDRLLVTTSTLEKTNILTVEEVFKFFKQKNIFTKLKIPLLFAPISYPSLSEDMNKVFPMCPYLFGLMIGGRLSCWEIKDILEQNGYYLNLYNSHKPPKARFTLWKDPNYIIPTEASRAHMSNYLYAPIEIRLAVLQGIIDSEAKIDKDYRVVFQVKNDPAKIEFYKSLISSFGFHVHDKYYKRRIHTGTDYICSFQSYSDNKIKLSRIESKQDKVAPYPINLLKKFKVISDVFPIKSDKHIEHIHLQVNSELGLYLVGTTYTIVSQCNQIK